ncbi:flagellar basal body rod protein FlgC [Parendozoicomonas haliclonae]|uniref:Flagellar basal-body rod protein FlgC n=1 Tax=Parendozoicomonas haliclonae TaxID=1960125 RepID=A0A1X7AMW8_9GAMM|nr:flagellar basal body rod protein FlgC [Parendozoicomonas haliclonae]SMA49651.1 Flagellar basal-body rod protein FlgC [Parendozoicomonas haliclonae]
MSMNTIYDIAGSAMTAQSQRLNTVASNLANAETPGSTPETTYRARKPVFAAVLEQTQQDLMDSTALNSAYSVEVKEIVESEAALEVRYQPDHPMANEQGNVYYPNVNVVEEMTEMMSASRNYQTNIELLSSANAMQQRLLTLGR